MVTVFKGQTVVILQDTLTPVNNITRIHNEFCSKKVENRKERTAKIVPENKGLLDVDANNNEQTTGQSSHRIDNKHSPIVSPLLTLNDGL